MLNFLKLIFILSLFNLGLNGQNVPLLTSDFSNSLEDGWGPDRAEILVDNGNPYLSLTPGFYSNGGQKLIIYNISNQWTGDYISRGITGINFNFANWSEIDSASLRIVISNAENAMKSGTFWVSNDVEFFPANHGWGTASFDISENSMHRVANQNSFLGLDTFDETLQSVASVRIISSILGTAAVGDQFEGYVGFDSITLVSVPEFNTISLIVSFIAFSFVLLVRMK